MQIYNIFVTLISSNSKCCEKVNPFMLEGTGNVGGPVARGPMVEIPRFSLFELSIGVIRNIDKN
jgi:hypothetical protein